MKTFRLLGFAASIIITLSGMASAASAAEFHASGELPTQLEAKALTNQEFTTQLSTIVCTEREIQQGTIAEEQLTSLTVELGYLDCSFKTLLGGTYPVHHINAEYLLDANGNVHVLKLIDIEVLEFGGGCTITIPPQIVEDAVTYENDSGHLIVNAKAKGIEYSGCGLEGESEGAGKTLISATSGAELSYS